MAICFTEKIFLRSKPLWVVYVYMDAAVETHPFITTTKFKPESIPEADFSKDREPILRFKNKMGMSMYPFSLRGLRVCAGSNESLRLRIDLRAPRKKPP